MKRGMMTRRKEVSRIVMWGETTCFGGWAWYLKEERVE